MSIRFFEQPTYKGGTEVVVVNTQALFIQAHIATDLMKHLAIVAGVPDGESSDGQQKFRLMTPDEVVERATGIAEKAWQEYEKRGWLLALPLPKPADYKEIRAHLAEDPTPSGEPSKQ